MPSQPLLFDEFDVKECSTTSSLKQGKKDFQNQCIRDVSLCQHELAGIFQKGSVTKKVKIRKYNYKLIGSIDDLDVRPFSAPITALAYWYINYVNQKKIAAANRSSNDKGLEPFESIQLTFIYISNQNAINLTLYQPKNNTYCDESHVFIHSFLQLIAHFEDTVKPIVIKLKERFEESFYFKSTVVKCDAFISPLLIQLATANCLYTADHKKISRCDAPVHLKITCIITNNRVVISFFWVSEDGSFSVSIHEAFQCDQTHHIIFSNLLYPIQNPMHSKIAMPFKAQSFQRLDISKIKPFIQKMVALRKKIGIELAIDPNIQQLKLNPVTPQCVVDVTPIENGGVLTISYVYHDRLTQPSDPSPTLIFDDFTYTNRDIDLEQKFKDSLLKYHPTLTEENTITYHSPYFDHVLSDLKENNIDGVCLSKKSKTSIKVNKIKITPQLEFKTRNGFLQPTIHWSHPEINKMLPHFDDHIQLGIPYFFDPQKNAIIPIDRSPIVDALSEPTALPLPIGMALYLAGHSSLKLKLPSSVNRLIDAFNKPHPPVSNDVKKILRPFQMEGLSWLLRLSQTPLNGILADDMGLGKTIQSIMLLKETSASSTNPSLIVMPKTLLFNWKKELEKFSPELRICQYDGPKRKKLIDSLHEYDVILCSYGSIRLDIKQLKDIRFHWLIIDEAQYVKNHATNTFKANKKIQANKRLLLTGTPLENSIGDLWSLVDIANPGYFGPYKPFETAYNEPKNQLLLKAAISPIMLRRRKEDVLNDLPPVSIQELWATTSADDLKTYTQFATQEWKRVEQIIEKDGLDQSKVHIFALMTKLRQWCAHPSLVLPIDEPGPKWLLFMDRLLEAIHNGHKVVVFSQFIPMITRIEEALNHHGILSVSLTGQTKNRQSIIETFNTDASIRVGLFSLKAGGVGINLTSADYVFLYDPWWNPSVEQQAIDRVHRIGQDRPVMVFKCLVAGTIEERLITYQNQKKALIDSIIEEQSIQHLTIHDIKNLIGI